MLKMETNYLDKYFYTDLVKLIIDYLCLKIDEEHISEVSDRYIGNIIVELNENKYNKESRKLIRKAKIRFNNIPNTLINSQSQRLCQNGTFWTYLDCCETFVSVIPSTLINLNYLNCYDTNVYVIPSTLINLTHLSCYDTKVSVIPATLINLTYLSCWSTNVTEIPVLLINLTYLSCWNTNISVIPDTLINLTELYCRYTKVTEIPAALINLTYLSCDFHCRTPLV